MDFVRHVFFYILYVIYKRFYTRRLFILKGGLYLLPIFGFFVFLFFSFNIVVPPRFSFFSEVFIIISINFFSFFNFIFCILFLLLAGFYCVYFFIIFNHGLNFQNLLNFSLVVREFILLVGHAFPILFFSLTMGWIFKTCWILV